MKIPKLASGSAFTSVLSVVSRLAGVPWGWVLAIAGFGLTLTFCLQLVQLLVPQDSHDKVVLWQTILDHRARGRSRTTKRHRPGASARPAVVPGPRGTAPPGRARASERTGARSP